MSPASYLTAPPRVAGAIIAPSLRSPRGLDDLRRADRRLSRARRGQRAPRSPLPRDVALLQAVQPPPGALRRRAGRRHRARRRFRRAGRRHGAPRGIARPAERLSHPARSAPRGARRGERDLRPPHRGRPAEVRVAAVDLGTNTTRLLVADVVDGDMEELHRETHITRLGEGVDTRGRLLPVPMTRVRNVLTDYRRRLESLGAERTLA